MKKGSHNLYFFGTTVNDPVYVGLDMSTFEMDSPAFETVMKHSLKSGAFAGSLKHIDQE